MKSLKIYRIPKFDKVEPGGINEARRLYFPAGEMAQIVNGIHFQYLAYVEFRYSDVAENYPRGNHYHKNKAEFIYILRGRLRSIYFHLETQEYGECIVEGGDLVCVEPYCVHAFLPLEFSQAVEYTNVEYDAEDTHKHILDFEKSYPILEKQDGFSFIEKEGKI
jgi:dTDP-4-dehydrorhamnose 3,5-epimerase-like enzyme